MVLGNCYGETSDKLRDSFPAVEYSAGCVVLRTLCKRFLSKYGYPLHIIIVKRIIVKAEIVKYQ
jgi:hypothetical protein